MTTSFLEVFREGFPTFLITFREGLEASLIIGLILAYLSKTDRMRHAREVWIGVGVALCLSLVAGGLVYQFMGQLDKNTERLFEGITTIAASGVLMWMILWMHRNAKHLGAELRQQVDGALENRSGLALGLLAFLAVGREGLETVLFLFATGMASDGSMLGTSVAGLSGLVLAVAAGVAVHRGVSVLDLRTFFRVSGVALIFFAAGLLAYGVHELQEAGAFPVVVGEVWNINGFLNDKEGVGEFLKALFGYNGNPSLLEVLLYTGFLFPALYGFLKPQAN
jgi:high-affinity iron transporter